MQAFRRLNSYLEGLYDVHTLDCVAYLLPFQQVIVSEHASGALTSAALSALSKFSLYGFLSRDLPRAREGIEMVGDCISHCVFEESHWQADEVVMLKLLELSTMVYRCDAAAHLSARSAWNVFQTCIMIRNQSRVSGPFFTSP
jgi:brefeldin A-resistance guanine nucleotide exchange factor 1